MHIIFIILYISASCNLETSPTHISDDIYIYTVSRVQGFWNHLPQIQTCLEVHHYILMRTILSLHLNMAHMDQEENTGNILIYNPKSENNMYNVHGTF